MDIEPFNLEWEQQDHQVIQALYDHETDKPKELRHKTFIVDGSEWTSWTMRDHLYKKLRYPTQARGLFTMRRPDGKYTVKVRGYDKFFNINETEATQWHVLKNNVQGPYEITAKENGCIIFITATSCTQLIATSKHTIPEPRDGNSHGGMGYRWLLTHLARSQHTPADLASWLYKYRLTLIAELCDDGFEEHVVPYKPEQRGLYLHGINYNTTTLRTLPIDTVHRIAHQFGFFTVDAQVVDHLDEVRHLADKVQQNMTGERESEGIVVRCHSQQQQQQQQHDNNNNNNNNNNQDFFFKVKNETYLVYREYREITKSRVKVVDGVVEWVMDSKKLKIKYEKSLYYVQWLQDRVADHPEWFSRYLENQGIVAVRQAFELDWANGIIPVLDNQLDKWVERDSK